MRVLLPKYTTPLRLNPLGVYSEATQQWIIPQ